MSNKNLYDQLQTLQKSEAETLVRDLEIELLDPETKRAQSGRDITYLNWRYRDPSGKNPEWKNRSTPIFTDEAKVLLSNGPYEQGRLYRVNAQKDQEGYWKWNTVQSTDLQQQREQQMQSFAQDRQSVEQQKLNPASQMSQGYEQQR